MENKVLKLGCSKCYSSLAISVTNRHWTLLLFMLMILCSSCHCLTDGHGVVVDSATDLPLDSVVARSYVNSVKDHAYEGEMITDITGLFVGSTGITGGFFGCPDLVVQFSRSGYETKAVTNPNDTIRLVKQ